MNLRLIIVACVLSSASGCAQTRQSDPAATAVFRNATTLEVSATEYRVAPPDKLRLHAPGIKELDQFTTAVRPDGKIELGLIGEISVAGKTPNEIAQSVTTAAARYYNDAQIRVEVAEYNSKFYEVFGTAVRDGGR